MLFLVQTVLLSRMRRMGLLVLLLLVVVGLAATAAEACNPNRSPNGAYNYYSGSNTGPTFDGGRCIIGTGVFPIVRNPYVQSGDVTTWTALVDGGNGEIIQEGWRNITPNYTRQNFAEWVLSNGHVQNMKTWAPDPVGTQPGYQVLYSGGAFHINYNGANRYNWTDTSYQGCWVQNESEIHDVNSQMPGVSATHESFVPGLSVQFSGTGTWQMIDPSNYQHGSQTINGLYNFGSPATSCFDATTDHYGAYITYSGGLSGQSGPETCSVDPVYGGNGLDITNGIHFGGSETDSPNFYTDMWDECQ
jgi:hypothetical protein